jgi:hypothetical protein
MQIKGGYFRKGEVILFKKETDHVVNCLGALRQSQEPCKARWEQASGDMVSQALKIQFAFFFFNTPQGLTNSLEVW